MADRFVRIQHPRIEGTAEVTERAYLRLKAKGWGLADTQPIVDTATPPPTEAKRPQKNDSTEAWRAYAIARHMPEEQANGMGRDELVDHYTALDTPQEP